MVPEINEKNDQNKIVIQRLQKILQDRQLLWDMISCHLEERKHHIGIDEFWLVRNIFLRYYNPFYLYNINPQDYFFCMLTRRDDHNMEYFVAWFKFFLCESRPIWMNYDVLLQQWTNGFLHDQNMFSEIIRQIDMMIEMWKNVAPDDSQQTNSFVQHMVDQCFQQSKNDLNKLTSFLLISVSIAHLEKRIHWIRFLRMLAAKREILSLRITCLPHQ
jgi:hypothetical protein